MILKRIFESQKTGFYVDVGAHHPKRFSNTYYFYKRGWSGINIDAMPESMKSFNKYRKRDLNIETGVGTNRESLNYFIFNEPALNSFDKSLSIQRDAELNQYSIVAVNKVPCKPLSEILLTHMNKGQEIDFISVDVEGMDLDVLKSNDWSLFRPKFVLVEILGEYLDVLEDSPITVFLTQQNYRIYAKCVNTVFYRLEVDR